MKPWSFGNRCGRAAAFLAVLGACGVFGVLQGADSKQDEDVAESMVSQLKAKKLRTDEKRLLTGTDGGGNMIVFFDDRQIVRLTITVRLSNRSVITDYFFKDGNLIMWEYLTKFAVFDSSERTLRPAGKGEQAGEVRETMLFREQKLLRWTLWSNLLREEIADPIGDWKNALAEAEFFYAAAQRPESEIDMENFLTKGGQVEQKP